MIHLYESPPRRDKEQVTIKISCFTFECKIYMYYEIDHILLIVMWMDEKEGKQKITSPKKLRDPTLKLEIAKKRSE